MKLLESIMKKTKIACGGIVIAIMTSCAPSVVTDMYTNNYEAISPDSVRVFMANEEVPSHTLAIGEVKVIDRGFAIKGSYEHVLDLAVKATAKNGGNGLVITEHRFPDMRSTIHRIWGTMLRMPQSVRDSSVAKESFRQALAQSENDEFKQVYQEYLHRKQIKEQLEQAPRNILRFSVGPSWLMSKYQIGNRLYESKCGIDIETEYDHIWKTGFGIGINYLHNYTSFDEGITMRLNYIGPSFVMALPYKNTRWDVAFGMGYSNYSESIDRISYSESHIAPLIRMGWEYQVNKQMALGIQMNMITIKLDKPDDVVLEKDEFYGIQRLGIQAGVRYYF